MSTPEWLDRAGVKPQLPGAFWMENRAGRGWSFPIAEGTRRAATAPGEGTATSRWAGYANAGNASMPMPGAAIAMGHDCV